jgi:hypothetical protein
MSARLIRNSILCRLVRLKCGTRRQSVRKSMSADEKERKEYTANLPVCLGIAATCFAQDPYRRQFWTPPKSPPKRAHVHLLQPLT